MFDLCSWDLCSEISRYCSTGDSWELGDDLTDLQCSYSVVYISGIFVRTLQVSGEEVSWNCVVIF